jgi:hypothetical protein
LLLLKLLYMNPLFGLRRCDGILATDRGAPIA